MLQDAFWALERRTARATLRAVWNIVPQLPLAARAVAGGVLGTASAPLTACRSRRGAFERVCRKPRTVGEPVCPA